MDGMIIVVFLLGVCVGGLLPILFGPSSGEGYDERKALPPIDYVDADPEQADARKENGNGEKI